MKAGSAAAILIFSMVGTVVLAGKTGYTDPSNPSNLPPLSTSYQGLWWNESESGWGVNFSHQGLTLFGTLFNYDASGRDLWLVMSAGSRGDNGTLTYTYQGSTVTKQITRQVFSSTSVPACS